MQRQCLVSLLIATTPHAFGNWITPGPTNSFTGVVDYIIIMFWIYRCTSWNILTFIFIYSLQPSVFVAATTLRFDGTQYMKILLPEESSTTVEDISLRFKSRRPNGLLFATMSSKSNDRLELMLEGARIRFDVNLGSGSRVSLSFYLSL